MCANAIALGVPCFINNGWSTPVSAYLVQETTRFAQFGPISGSTYRVGVRLAPGVGSLLQRQTVDVDLRKYLRLGSTSSLLAFRARGFYSTGDNPDYFYFGGNGELRGYPYYSFAGNQGFFANAELRIPIIDLALTPIGVIGPIRGTAFIGMGGAKFQGQPYQFSSSEPGFSFINDPVFGEPTTGWRLEDGRAFVRLRAAAVLPRLPDALRLDEVHRLRGHEQQPGTSASGWDTTSELKSGSSSPGSV